MSAQAKWVAQVLSGRVTLPSEEDMEADIQAFYKLLKERNVPVRYTHNLVRTPSLAGLGFDSVSVSVHMCTTSTLHTHSAC
jgi:hypothetical protein